MLDFSYKPHSKIYLNRRLISLFYLLLVYCSGVCIDKSLSYFSSLA